MIEPPKRKQSKTINVSPTR
jgi:hypothetical protein